MFWFVLVFFVCFFLLPLSQIITVTVDWMFWLENGHEYPETELNCYFVPLSYPPVFVSCVSDVSTVADNCTTGIDWGVRLFDSYFSHWKKNRVVFQSFFSELISASLLSFCLSALLFLWCSGRVGLPSSVPSINSNCPTSVLPSSHRTDDARRQQYSPGNLVVRRYLLLDQ